MPPENTGTQPEQKTETITLSRRAYYFLKLWCDCLPQKEELADYYASMHYKIKNGDDNDLTAREKLILERLLSASPLSRANLYDYFTIFPVITIKETFWDKFPETLNQRRDLVFSSNYERMQDTVEDEWLKKDRLVRYEISEKLYGKLAKFEFEQADAIAKKNADAMNNKLYQKIKATYYIKYFSARYKLFGQPLLLDKNQSETLLNEKQFAIIQGRAATGKTQLALVKNLFLIDQLQLKPENILLLSFDPAVSSNLEYLASEGLTSSENDEHIGKIALNTKDVLIEASGAKDQVMIEDKFLFFKAFLNELWKSDKDFRKYIWDFFGNSQSYISKLSLKNLDRYYHYNQNIRYYSLRGEMMKSLGEKWVADYLYKNGINYSVNKSFNNGLIKTEDEKLASFLRTAKPQTIASIYLTDYDYVWEHAIIDPNEKDISQKIEFDKLHGFPWLTFKSQLDWKREFWGPWRKNLADETNPEIQEIVRVNGMLETSIVDMKEGKIKFEEKLSGILKEAGIKTKEIAVKEIEDTVWTDNEDYIVRLLLSFVERHQQKYQDNPKVFRGKCDAYEDEPFIHGFLKLGLLVLDKYQEQLDLPLQKRFSSLQTYPEYKLDYNQLVFKSLKVIADGKLDKLIADLSWIIIDEYQEFSELYQRLVTAILKVNPRIRIFAIGDSWQACKYLQGAETVYFDDFMTNYKDTEMLPLITNFRSRRKLTVGSNRFMKFYKFHGGSALVYKPGNDPAIFTFEVPTDPSGSPLNGYIGKCVEIIKSHPDWVTLLVHSFVRGQLFNLDKFYFSLQNALLEQKIYQTEADVQMHVFADYPENLTGAEADTVIMLEVENEVYPNLSPDSELFRIFGEDIMSLEASEQRAFYQAVSRARESLWLLTRKDRHSEYLEPFD